MQEAPKITSTDLDIRHYIYSTFAEKARPPATREISAFKSLSIDEIEGSLDRLAQAHHIVLAPGAHTIWMAHPFSGLPTNYITKVEGKSYWGNGVWDIFGISAILNKAAEVHAPCGCGQCNEQMNLYVQPGRSITSDWLVHFAVPAANFWDDIGYTGRTILPFSSKEHLHLWLAKREAATGSTISMQTCWELAQRWYKGRIERDWQRPDAFAIQKLFDSLGLTGDFWRVA